MTDPILGSIVSTVAKAVQEPGDSPKFRQAREEAGQVAVSVIGAVNTCLLPLVALNAAARKAREYFDGKFLSDISAATAGIPPDQLVEPKPYVAGPALQGLTFAFEQDELREMYLKLLASSMDRRNQDVAHPAFAEIIKQLTSEEAKILSAILKHPMPLPIIEIRRRVEPPKKPNQPYGPYRTLLKHVMSLQDSDTGELVALPSMQSAVDNLLRLGLVEVSYDLSLQGDKYSWAEQRPEYVKLAESHPKELLWIKNGMIERTSMGCNFARAVGMEAEPAPSG